MDDLYSWMIRGVHAVRIDPRRRWGRHQGLRQLLADDSPMTSPSEPLQALAAALRRQTLGQGLSRLRPKEAEVIRLAYLEGLANRAIAERLGTSVSTVRRLLASALQKMDSHMRKAGGSISALALLALGALHAVSGRLERSLWSSAPEGERVASLLATGTTVVAALAVVSVATPLPAVQPVHPAVVSSGSVPAHALNGLAPLPSTALVRDSQDTSADDTGGQPSAVSASPATTPAEADVNNSCGRKPTSAPPSVPVGPRVGHPTGPPVTHTKPGGCHS